MEYKPYGFNSGATNIASEELLVASSLTGEALNTVSMRLAVDLVQKRANQAHTKYVSVAKARYKNGSALTGSLTSGSGNQRWLDIVAGSKYMHANTFFFLQNFGLPIGQAAGMMYVTYYVWYKTQRIDT